MANYNNTIFKTDNPEIYKTVIDRFEIMKGANRDEWFYNQHKLLCLTAGGKSMDVSEYHKLPPDVQNAYLNGLSEIYIKTRNDTFHDQAIELSKQFPRDKMICKYSFEHDWHFTETTVEYLDGKDTNIGHKYRPQFIGDIPYLPDLIGESESKAVLQKIRNFVLALYDKKLFHEGETVSFTFVRGKYKFETTIPFGPHYDVNVYSGQETKKTEWKLIDPNYNNELPF